MCHPTSAVPVPGIAWPFIKVHHQIIDFLGGRQIWQAPWRSGFPALDGHAIHLTEDSGAFGRGTTGTAPLRLVGNASGYAGRSGKQSWNFETIYLQTRHTNSKMCFWAFNMHCRVPLMIPWQKGQWGLMKASGCDALTFSPCALLEVWDCRFQVRITCPLCPMPKTSETFPSYSTSSRNSAPWKVRLSCLWARIQGGRRQERDVSRYHRSSLFLLVMLGCEQGDSNECAQFWVGVQLPPFPGTGQRLATHCVSSRWMRKSYIRMDTKKRTTVMSPKRRQTSRFKLCENCILMRVLGYPLKFHTKVTGACALHLIS